MVLMIINLKVVQKRGDSFVIALGSEKDNIAIMDFYKNEILNRDKIEYYMSYMVADLLELYYTLHMPSRFGDLIRHDIDQSHLNLLDKFRMAKVGLDYFGVTINLEELVEHLNLKVNVSTIEQILTAAMKKYMINIKYK
ncbi:MAG: hypothetical protein ACJATI_002525 [Halioglobus sp.]|jgi:hypothetical protein